MNSKLLRRLLLGLVVPAVALAGCADDGAEEVGGDEAATDDGVFDNGVGAGDNETNESVDTCVSGEEILSGDASPDPTEELGNQTSEACPGEA